MLLMIKNKNGIVLMNVLGFITFWIAALSAVFVFVYNDTTTIHRHTDDDIAYAEAVSAIDAAYQVIGPALMAGTYEPEDSNWIAFHESLGITVQKIGDTYMLSRGVGRRLYSGVISYTGSSTVDEIFLLDGSQQISGDTFRTDTILNQYLQHIGLDEYVTDFSSLDNLVDFNYDFKVSQSNQLSLDMVGDTYFSDDLELSGSRTTHLNTDGHILYIDGDLTVSISVSNSFYLNGIVIVDGSVKIANNKKIMGILIINGNLEIGNGVNVEGLIIVNGSTSIGSNVRFGTPTTPSMIFSKKDIEIDGLFNLYGFLFSEEEIKIGNGLGNGSNQLIGGIFSYVSEPDIGKNYGPIQPLDIQIINNQDYFAFFNGGSSVYNLSYSNPKVS